MRISVWRSDVCSADLSVANDLRGGHGRGVSSRSRPGFSEGHKHRGMWRYFRKFEAPSRNIVVRAGVWLAIWLHWASRLPAVLPANRRAGAPWLASRLDLVGAASTEVSLRLHLPL